MLNRLHRRSHFAVRCLRPLSRSYSVFVFPGQGAQQIGMGKDLAAESSLAREVFEEIDEALRLRLSHTMWNGTDLELKATEVTQPALFAHGMAAFKTLQVRRSFVWLDLLQDECWTTSPLNQLSYGAWFCSPVFHPSKSSRVRVVAPQLPSWATQSANTLRWLRRAVLTSRAVPGCCGCADSSCGLQPKRCVKRAASNK